MYGVDNMQSHVYIYVLPTQRVSFQIVSAKMVSDR